MPHKKMGSSKLFTVTQVNDVWDVCLFAKQVPSRERGHDRTSWSARRSDVPVEIVSAPRSSKRFFHAVEMQGPC